VPESDACTHVEGQVVSDASVREVDLGHRVRTKLLFEFVFVDLALEFDRKPAAGG